MSPMQAAQSLPLYTHHTAPTLHIGAWCPQTDRIHGQALMRCVEVSPFGSLPCTGVAGPYPCKPTDLAALCQPHHALQAALLLHDRHPPGAGVAAVLVPESSAAQGHEHRRGQAAALPAQCLLGAVCMRNLRLACKWALRVTHAPTPSIAFTAMHTLCEQEA